MRARVFGGAACVCVELPLLTRMRALLARGGCRRLEQSTPPLGAALPYGVATTHLKPLSQLTPTTHAPRPQPPTHTHHHARPGYAEVRRGRRLVVSFIMTAVNYEYCFYYMLYQV